MKFKIKHFFILMILSLIFVGCGAKNQKANNDKITSPTNELNFSDIKRSDVKIRIAALKGPTAIGLAKLNDDIVTKKITKPQYEIQVLDKPDLVMPKILSGEVDMAALPINMASIIYNKSNGKFQEIAINTLGVLSIVENGNSINSINDLKGKTIISSGKGGVPEYVLNHILLSNNINPKTDVTIDWKNDHSQVLAEMIKLKDSVALLPQPFISAAQLKNNNIRIALDLNTLWNDIHSKDKSTFITGVMIVNKEFANKNIDAIKAFMNDYKDSIDFIKKDINTSAKLIANWNLFPEPVARKALENIPIVFKYNNDMMNESKAFLEILYKENPKSIGSKLPNDDFYLILK